MTRATFSARFLLVALVLWWAGAGLAAAQGTAIAHTPIPFAVRGQPLTLKAKVTGRFDGSAASCR